MFGTIGGPELVLILVIALIVFGPRKLPEMGKSLGKMLVEFRRASNDFKRTIEDEVEAEKVRPPQPPQAPALREAGLSADGPAGSAPPPAGPVLAAPEGTIAVGTPDSPSSVSPS